MSELKLKVGDVVYLNSEKSIKMTVTNPSSQFGVEVYYFNEIKKEFVKGHFPANALTLAD